MTQFNEEEHPWRNPIRVGELCSVYLDKYPVTKGHTLFVPAHDDDMHIAVCFAAALNAGGRMVQDGECDDFNIGYNSGSTAGRSVDWPHVHLIPRRHGDVDNPRGGVRGVIPSKQDYKHE